MTTPRVYFQRNTLQRAQDARHAEIRARIVTADTIAEVQHLLDEGHRLRAGRLLAPRHIDDLGTVSRDRLKTLAARKADQAVGAGAPD